MTSPIPYIWTGDSFRPETRRALAEAQSRYGEGEVVPLDVANPRSRASHDHFFAVVGEAWATLPETMKDRFPTSESLRHYALCMSGHCDVETFVASSRAEALRLASFVRKGEVIVTVDGPTVTRLTPHSQSQKAMGGRVFQQSKADCLDVIAGLLDVPAQALGVAA